MKKNCYYRIDFPSGTFSKYVKVNDESTTIYKVSGYDVLKTKDGFLSITKFKGVDITKESLRIMEKSYRIEKINKNDFNMVSKAYVFLNKERKKLCMITKKQ